MTFHLSIGDLEQERFSGEVHSLIVPGSAGYLEILANHAPLLTTLQAGTVTLKRGEEKIEYQIKSGLLEVQQNQAILLI